MTTIAEIRARRAAITPGEWEAGVEVTQDHYIVTAKFQSDPQFGMAVCECNVSHDARFIAAAPADIDHLLATIDKLAAALVEARASLRMATAFSNDEMGLFDDEKPYYDDARKTVQQEFGL